MVDRVDLGGDLCESRPHLRPRHVEEAAAEVGECVRVQLVLGQHREQSAWCGQHSLVPGDHLEGGTAAQGTEPHSPSSGSSCLACEGGPGVLRKNIAKEFLFRLKLFRTSKVKTELNFV